MSALMTLKKKIGFVGGIAIFVALMVAPLPVDVQIKRTLAVLALCAVWWGTEAVSIYATSLVPAVLLPLLGILPLQETLSQYANRLVFLFLGGFIIARSMMKWGVDRRLALVILGRVGSSSKLLVLYFMGLTAFLSAFISNTATTANGNPTLSHSKNVISRPRSDWEKPASRTLGGVPTSVATPPMVAA